MSRRFWLRSGDYVGDEGWSVCVGNAGIVEDARCDVDEEIIRLANTECVSRHAASPEKDTQPLSIP